MIRTWLLTSTTYGTWLPGDPRGSVSTVKDGPGSRVRHNVYGTPYDPGMAGLRRSAQANLKCPPILLTAEQARVVLAQFQETARYRGWVLHAAAVMANHFHLVVSAPEEVPAANLLRDFKSYAARALNRQWPKPASGTWWTESGSRRPLAGDDALEAAIHYVENQPGVLAMMSATAVDPGEGSSERECEPS